jgi:peptidoglycan/LPS O-acetylase OafA/YrhL
MSQPAANQSLDQRRIAHLDGLRGVAILLVILFHAYARWPDRVPYGDRFAHLVVTEYGHYGVQLFFLISGFVILMTLERSATYVEFLGKRWLRLFPGMLLASALILLTAPLLSGRPSGTPTLRDALPGLTFIEPSWWAALFGSGGSLDATLPHQGYSQGVLEGTFWSLFVEVKFYVVAGALFFVLGAKRTVIVLIAAAVAFRAIIVAEKAGLLGATTLALVDILSLKHAGWFAAGAAFYLAVRDSAPVRPLRRSAWFWTGLAVAALTSAKPSALAETAALLGITGLFAASLAVPRLQRLLSVRVLLFVGFISYPLYLIHENALIALIGVLGSTSLGVLGPLLPLPALAIIVTVAWGIAAVGEPRLRCIIRALPVWFAQLFGQRSGSARGILSSSGSSTSASRSASVSRASGSSR